MLWAHHGRNGAVLNSEDEIGSSEESTRQKRHNPTKKRKTKMTEMDEVQDRNGRIQPKEHSRTSTQEDSRTEAKRK